MSYIAKCLNCGREEFWTNEPPKHYICDDCAAQDRKRESRSCADREIDEWLER